MLQLLASTVQNRPMVNTIKILDFYIGMHQHGAGQVLLIWVLGPSDSGVQYWNCPPYLIRWALYTRLPCSHNIYIYTCSFIFIYLYEHKYMYIYIYVYVCSFIFIYIYEHIYIYIYMHKEIGRYIGRWMDYLGTWTF